jgi:poly(A) polymerase
MTELTAPADDWRLVSADAAADILTLDPHLARLIAHVEAADSPVERRDALTALLVSDNPAAGLRLLELEGSLARLLPEIAGLRGVSQLPDHVMDALDHTLLAVDAAPPVPLSRWTALFHDSGKALTGLTTPNGRRRFFGHENVGADLARATLPRFALSAPFIAQVARLIELHLRPLAYREEWTNAAVRRLLDEAGTLWPALLAQARADLLGYQPEPIERGLVNLDRLEERTQAVLAPPPPSPPGSPLDGNELQAIFARPPGPWLRRVKTILDTAVQSGLLAPDDKTGAVQLAAQVLDGDDGVDEG